MKIQNCLGTLFLLELVRTHVPSLLPFALYFE